LKASVYYKSLSQAPDFANYGKRKIVWADAQIWERVFSLGGGFEYMGPRAIFLGRSFCINRTNYLLSFRCCISFPAIGRTVHSTCYPESCAW